jgi:hypothetical protein
VGSEDRTDSACAEFDVWRVCSRFEVEYESYMFRGRVKIGRAASIPWANVEVDGNSLRGCLFECAIESTLHSSRPDRTHRNGNWSVVSILCLPYAMEKERTYLRDTEKMTDGKL